MVKAVSKEIESKEKAGNFVEHSNIRRELFGVFSFAFFTICGFRL
jgi:hypothetical protein